LTLATEDKATLTLAADNLSMLMHPDGGFAAVGDTETASARGAARYDSGAQWLLSEGVSGDVPESGSWLFRETGYAVFRAQYAPREATYLFLTVAHHSRNHKHLDTGSFEWSDRGRRVLIDSGKWGYGASEERRYVTGAAAHNIVETAGVVGSPGDLPSEHPLLSSFDSGAIFGFTAEMKAPRKLIDARVRRTVIGLPGEWLIVVDEVDELLPSKQTVWFHLAPEFELHREEENRYLAMLHGRPQLAIFPLLPVREASAYKGVQEPRMLGWHSPSYGELQPSWQVGYQASGRSVRMATAFRWLDHEADRLLTNAGAEENVLRLCWREAGKIHGARISFVDGNTEVAACE
jgi:hypothetical protein